MLRSIPTNAEQNILFENQMGEKLNWRAKPINKTAEIELIISFLNFLICFNNYYTFTFRCVVSLCVCLFVCICIEFSLKIFTTFAFACTLSLSILRPRANLALRKLIKL